MKHFIRYIILTVYVLIVLVPIFTIFLDTYTECRTDEIPKEGIIGEITRDKYYEQEFICNKNGLKTIRLLLATYGRINESELYISLLSNEKVVQKWTIQSKKLRDNTYYPLLLDQRIDKSKGKKFILLIESNANSENSVTAYKNSSGNYEGLFCNAISMKNESICYQLEYKNQFMDERGIKFIIRFLILTCMIIVVWIVLQDLHLESIKVFLVLWCSLSLLYICSLTLFNVPDEHDHFCRSLEISYGDLIAELNEKGSAGGCELPLNVDLNILRANWQMFEENKGLELTNDLLVFKEFSNTALYSPITYLPQALGINFARHITSNIAIIAYTGRFLNWLCITVILCLAIKIIPFGKKVLILIAMIPMNIHESISLAPDGMVVALSALMIALVLNLIHRHKNTLNKKEIIILYILAIIISLYKITFLPFCLSYILIPKERFKAGLRGKLMHATILLISVCFASLSWLKICNIFLLRLGTDGRLQIRYILRYPVRYLITLSRTWVSGAHDRVFTMLGNSLGWLAIPTVGIISILYLLVLVHNMKPGMRKCSFIELSHKFVWGSIVFITILLIVTSLYIQWTPIYSNTVMGLQGRYYLPLLLPTYLLLTKDGYVENAEERFDMGCQYVILIANVSACICMLFSCI